MHMCMVISGMKSIPWLLATRTYHSLLISIVVSTVTTTEQSRGPRYLSGWTLVPSLSFSHYPLRRLLDSLATSQPLFHIDIYTTAILIKYDTPIPSDSTYYTHSTYIPFKRRNRVFNWRIQPKPVALWTRINHHLSFSIYHQARAGTTTITYSSFAPIDTPNKPTSCLFNLPLHLSSTRLVTTTS